MIVKCECDWEYNVDTGDEDWEECPNCDLPYKHIRISKWISVDDRLPPNTHVDNYLVYDETYGAVVSFYSPDYGDWDRLFFGLGESKYKKVTHWQPLPEPPEVNDE